MGGKILPPVNTCDGGEVDDNDDDRVAIDSVRTQEWNEIRHWTLPHTHSSFRTWIKRCKLCLYLLL